MTDVVEKQLKRIGVTVSKPVLAAICIIFGLLLIFLPGISLTLVAILVGIFFLIQGILLLVEYYEIARQQPQKSSSASA